MSNGKVSKKIQQVFPTIEQISFQILIEAYKGITNCNQYDLDWEEEQFNQELVVFMKKSRLRTKYKLTIGVERKLFNEEQSPIDTNNPKKLPRIDINIVSWNFQKDIELEYFFEAKNLSEKNWYKKSGAKVDASSYQRRYIQTGIENFRTGRYYNGSLIGYILEGGIEPIIDKLNTRLVKDTNRLKTIDKINFIKDFSDCYESKHITFSSKEINIKHIFFKF
ncbi:MAG: Unknown protein [uncultured Sulfurovum sp.]|uniref:Uncharacterized protein n=1 Tax=uncultured Sulfurovum sp. TaxID=269237 RepID=A0A6S6SAQ6_9BACT|nr:MAG: Unknown protein [uncultured Sulfurovum sp.]